jgi:DNA-binding transcriptional ArsR family regulator
MVEYSLNLDIIFSSLSDPTRRDILQRLALKELTVGEVAKKYKNLTLAAISKHLKVLEKAHLIVKRRDGKQQYVQLAPAALKGAEHYLQQYGLMVDKQLDSLEKYLKQEIRNA